MVKTKPRLIERYAVDKEDVHYLYPEEFWLEMYYFVRLRELGAPYDPPAFNRKVRKIIQVYRNFGLDKSKEYVNIIIKNTRTMIL